MKAISIRQPWAWLIVQGYKTVENRTWATRIRGEILIHAGKAADREDEKIIREVCAELGVDMPEKLDRGGIVGVVDIVDCTLEPTDETDLDWHEPGVYAWILRNPRPLPFVPYPGKLNFINVPDELIDHSASPCACPLHRSRQSG